MDRINCLESIYNASCNGAIYEEKWGSKWAGDWLKLADGEPEAQAVIEQYNSIKSWSTKFCLLPGEAGCGKVTFYLPVSRPLSLWGSGLTDLQHRAELDIPLEVDHDYCSESDTDWRRVKLCPLFPSKTNGSRTDCGSRFLNLWLLFISRIKHLSF